jgi:soluble lytic murein transglycosylase
MRLLGIVLFCLSMSCHALSGEAYLERFNRYRAWYQQLPINPPAPFLDFVQEKTPLAKKLREKWLYELARIKDWAHYDQYYQPSHDLNLICYKQLAQHYLGQDRLKEAIPIWLSGSSQPKACNPLLDFLVKSPYFTQDLISKRLVLALDNRNIGLSRYLIKLYRTPHLADLQTLTTIYQNPLKVRDLNGQGLNSELILYGLKRLATANMDKAISIWKIKQALLNERQQQAFIGYVALYKALRGQSDAQAWFEKIKPRYFNERLLDWQLRFALKKKAWSRVVSLINQQKKEDNPAWQYWLARALEAQGKKAEALPIYRKLAATRQYYGFLASYRLHQAPSFENASRAVDLTLLQPYQSFLDEMKHLYQSKAQAQASRWLNDFVSELPTNEAIAVLTWINQQLHWYAKSVFLCNDEPLKDQLNLRFPLAYLQSVEQNAKRYGLSAELIYAIIRQESGFREDAVSMVGALGLMQLMPHTAQIIAKANKIPYTEAKQLFISEKNIALGSAYLQYLNKHFNNHAVLAAAAYNAGPRQLLRWLNAYPTSEMDLWIESIPWQETRNYLKNVISFYTVYRYRLNRKPDLGSMLSMLNRS